MQAALEAARLCATRTASISTSRSARRCTTRAAPTRRSHIMRKANALRLKIEPYRSDGDHTRLVDRCVEVFTAEAFAERPGGCDAPDPIFIVGLPRAGLDPDRADPFVATAWSKAPSELPDIPAARAQSRARIQTAASTLGTDGAPRAGRGISEASRRPAADTSGRSSSTSCRTTGCSCPSSS